MITARPLDSVNEVAALESRLRVDIASLAIEPYEMKFPEARSQSPRARTQRPLRPPIPRMTKP